MVDGAPDSEPDNDARPEEGPILSPEELDISDNENVTQIDEGRFVVSPGSGGPSPEQARDASNKSKSSAQPDQQSPDTREQRPDQSTKQSQPAERATKQSKPTTESKLTQETVHRWLRESFENNSSRYAFDVTATFDGQVSQRRMASNDVVTIFESLMLWYAQQVDSNTPVEEILGILLMESNVPVRYPPESVHNPVKSSNLSPDDSIADLLEAVKNDDGLQL